MCKITCQVSKWNIFYLAFEKPCMNKSVHTFLSRGSIAQDYNISRCCTIMCTSPIYYIYKGVFVMRVLRTCWTDFNNQKCFGIVHSWAVIIAIRHLYLTHNPGWHMGPNGFPGRTLKTSCLAALVDMVKFHDA